MGHPEGPAHDSLLLKAYAQTPNQVRPISCTQHDKRIAFHTCVSRVGSSDSVGVRRSLRTRKCNKYEKSHVLAKMHWRKYEQIIYDNRCDNILLFALNIRGGSRISDRRFGCIKVFGFALLILSLFFLNIP